MQKDMIFILKKKIPQSVKWLILWDFFDVLSMFIYRTILKCVRFFCCK